MVGNLLKSVPFQTVPFFPMPFFPMEVFAEHGDMRSA